MAAKTATAGTSKYTVFGDRQVLFCDLATVADDDTYVPVGFGVIDQITVSADAAVIVEPNISGTTVTFNVSSGTPGLRVQVIGS